MELNLFVEFPSEFALLEEVSLYLQLSAIPTGNIIAPLLPSLITIIPRVWSQWWKDDFPWWELCLPCDP